MRPQFASVILLALVFACPLSAQTVDSEEREPDFKALKVEGIAPLSGDDDPRVLYILPWQPPSMPRRPRAELVDEAPDLLAPVDPYVLEYHRHFRETLNPYQDSSLSLQ